MTTREAGGPTTSIHAGSATNQWRLQAAMQASPNRIRELGLMAAETRKLILRSVNKAGAGHVGGPLSATDMLVSLYFDVMRVDPARPDWENRDRFVLSKGHSSIAVYTVLALRGYFPVAELATFDQIDSRLQGHPDMLKLPGLDMSTGSLGIGLSTGVGMALGARLKKLDFHTYVMLGDGEIQEGQVWEAAFVANRYKLDNLTAILDYNKLQQYGFTREISGDTRKPMISIEDPAAKFAAWGWKTLEIDGHDIAAFIDACAEAKTIKGRPTVIIANTVKGKGVSFMEGDPGWHARVPTAAELEAALVELDANAAKL
jgi:transketolase